MLRLIFLLSFLGVPVFAEYMAYDCNQVASACNFSGFPANGPLPPGFVPGQLPPGVQPGLIYLQGPASPDGAWVTFILHDLDGDGQVWEWHDGQYFQSFIFGSGLHVIAVNDVGEFVGLAAQGCGGVNFGAYFVNGIGCGSVLPGILVRDLNNPAYNNEIPVIEALNDASQILIQPTCPGCNFNPVLLSPVNPLAVPEPSSVILLLPMLAALATHCSCRRSCKNPITASRKL